MLDAKHSQMSLAPTLRHLHMCIALQHSTVYIDKYQYCICERVNVNICYNISLALSPVDLI